MALGCALPAQALAGTGPALAGFAQNTSTLASVISVAVSGNYAYTTAYHAGALTAVDISNPSSPTVAGSSAPFLDTNLIGGSNVTIAGGYAFVVSKNRNAAKESTAGSCTTGNNDDGNGNSLTILDIHTNPAVPAIVGTIRDTSKLFGAYGIAVQGNYAYVAYQGQLVGQPCVPDTSWGGFTVIDITNPAGPTIVANIDDGSLPSPFTGKNSLEHPTSVAISGHYAFVNAFYNSGIDVIDISNPTAPKLVTWMYNTSLKYAVDLAVQGNYLYVANQIGGTAPQLTVLSISTPTAPKIVGTVSDAADLAGAYRIHVRGSFAYESGSSVNSVGVIDVSDPTHPQVVGSLIDNTHLHGTTGLDLDPTGAYVIAVSAHLSTETGGSGYPPYPLQTGGTTATGTVSVIQLDPAPISVSINSEPTNPTGQTSASFGFSVNDSVSTVRCSLDGAPYALCTSSTTQNYSSLSQGSHTFTVEAIDSAGNTNTASYTWVVGGTLQNTSAPTIDAGPATAGQTINVTSNGAWNGSPAPTSYTYQWESCDQSGSNCTPITGQTGSSYVAQSSDVGATIEVAVTASNGVSSATANSAPTSIVTGAPVNTGLPGITGTAAVGSQLTASSGSWNGYPAPSFTYAWQDCVSGTCNPNGATGSTYTLQSSDTGATIEVVVTASNGVGTPSSATSAPTGTVSSAPYSTSAPTISGTAAQGATLTVASTGGWGGYPAPTSFSYQWQSCDQSGGGCTPISGANASSYTLQASDVATTVEVTVTADNGNGTGSGSSAPSAIVTGPPAKTSAPTVTGTATLGATLSASSGGWNAYPAPSFTYQWQRCGEAGGNCLAISGAASASYVLQRSDVGHTIRVLVTATNGSGNSSASSAATAIVSGPPMNLTPPIVSGTVTQGSTLTTTNGTWSAYPAPAYSYQWQRCAGSASACTSITNATASTYVVSSADAGYELRVGVRATNTVGSTLKYSALTGQVSATATVTFSTVHALRVKLRVTVFLLHNPGAQLVISAPAGERFAGSLKALERAIRVLDAHGHPLKDRLILRHGRIMLRLVGLHLPVRVTVSAAALAPAPRG